MRSQVARRVMKGSGRKTDLLGESVKLVEALGAEVVAQHMAPPTPFGKEQIVDTYAHLSFHRFSFLKRDSVSSVSAQVNQGFKPSIADARYSYRSQNTPRPAEI